MIFLAAGLMGCGSDDKSDSTAEPESADAADVRTTDTSADMGSDMSNPAISQLEKEEQRNGDPQRGYDYLLGGEYTGCGLPERVYSIASGLELLPGGEPAPVRESDLPYFLSKFETENGESVVGPNCLTCHAGQVEGELVIGAPGLGFDYGGLAADAEQLQRNRDVVSQQLNLTDAEIAELDKFAERLATIAPYVRPRVTGVANPADNLAAILFAHRDPQTLEWSDEPLLEPPPEYVVPVDTPPWWRMSKKNAMLYNTAGRGDHARIMMAASTLCVDDIEHARRIDSNMGDVHAYITSIEAPEYPYEVSQEAAERGEEVFGQHCSRCHGTYGTPAEETYPNLLVSVEEVGTDSALADAASQFSDRFIDWFNTGFYGESARLDPQDGYIAPPLDGIWATAPFLHNGSVPTLEALLDSSKRPTYWRVRLGLDQEAMGLPYEEATADESGSFFVYDTTEYGYGNAGHTYGDVLSDAQRRDLLEYLKTL